jgi:hypothetical protein
MKKLILLVAVILAGCTPPSQGPELYVYVFKNESTYQIDVIPAGGQTWDSVILSPNGGIATRELTIPIDELSFTWSNAQATDVNSYHEIDGSWSFTFVNATMYTYGFYNDSSIWVDVLPADNQLWSGIRLTDFSRWEQGYNTDSVRAKYAELSFTLVKVEGALHWDPSIEVEDLRITSEGGYEYFIRDPE